MELKNLATNVDSDTNSYRYTPEYIASYQYFQISLVLTPIPVTTDTGIVQFLLVCSSEKFLRPCGMRLLTPDMYFCSKTRSPYNIISIIGEHII